MVAELVWNVIGAKIADVVQGFGIAKSEGIAQSADIACHALM